MGVLSFLGVGALSYAQQGNVGVNTDTPQVTLQVDGKAAARTVADGIMAPRLTGNQLKDKDAVYTAIHAGALVYVTAAANPTTTKTAAVTSAGYYYFNGSVWVKTPADYREPWNVAGTDTPATLNTQNIYQMGKVVVGIKNPYLDLSVVQPGLAENLKNMSRMGTLTSGIGVSGEGRLGITLQRLVTDGYAANTKQVAMFLDHSTIGGVKYGAFSIWPINEDNTARTASAILNSDLETGKTVFGPIGSASSAAAFSGSYVDPYSTDKVTRTSRPRDRVMVNGRAFINNELTIGGDLNHKPKASLDVYGDARISTVADLRAKAAAAAADGTGYQKPAEAERKTGYLTSGPDGLVMRTLGMELGAASTSATNVTLGLNDYFYYLGNPVLAATHADNSTATTVNLPTSLDTGMAMGRSYIIRNGKTQPVTLSTNYLGKNGDTKNTIPVGQTLHLTYIAGSVNKWIEVDPLAYKAGIGISIDDATNTISAQEPWNVMGSSTQATSNTQDIYQNGKVGVGNFSSLTAANNGLSISGTNSVFNLYSPNNMYSSYYRVGTNNAATRIGYFGYGSSGSPRLFEWSNMDNKGTNETTINAILADRVGVNTTSPSAPFHVKGNTYLENRVSIGQAARGQWSPSFEGNDALLVVGNQSGSTTPNLRLTTNSNPTGESGYNIVFNNSNGSANQFASLIFDAREGAPANNTYAPAVEIKGIDRDKTNNRGGISIHTRGDRKGMLERFTVNKDGRIYIKNLGDAPMTDRHDKVLVANTDGQVGFMRKGSPVTVMQHPKRDITVPEKNPARSGVLHYTGFKVTLQPEDRMLYNLNVGVTQNTMGGSGSTFVRLRFLEASECNNGQQEYSTVGFGGSGRITAAAYQLGPVFASLGMGFSEHMGVITGAIGLKNTYSSAKTFYLYADTIGSGSSNGNYGSIRVPQVKLMFSWNETSIMQTEVSR